MSKFPSFSDIVTTTLRNCSSALADNLSRNNKVMDRFEKQRQWSWVWRHAINNMPYITKDLEKSLARDWEKKGALAKCLGIPVRHVDRALMEGTQPKKPDFVAKLKGYAGSYGTQLAAIRLANLGVLSEYPHWPAP